MIPNEDNIKILIIRWSLVRAQVGPQKSLDKPCKHYVYGAFFISGAEYGAE
ncbi:hypothetical protein C21_00759 [Arenibacter sp. NBRC 103722]|nr:hypothetical protein C21_00759 [Arenibacter sp. NBRC 103722]